MTLKEQIMKLQTYKMFEVEDTIYVERDDVLKILEQQEPCEDCISRQAVLEIVEREQFKGGAISEIEKLPSIKLQDTKEIYNKGFSDGQKALAEHLKLCKEELLCKIRTEIAFKSRIVLKNTPNDDWVVKWNECINEVLEIIDKYKAESEVQE